MTGAEDAGSLAGSSFCGFSPKMERDVAPWREGKTGIQHQTAASGHSPVYTMKRKSITTLR